MKPRTIVLTCLVLSIVIYYLYITRSSNSKHLKKTNIENFEDSSSSKDVEIGQLPDGLKPIQDPPLYQNLYESGILSPMLNFNLKIDPLRREVDYDTKKTHKRLLVPIHLINRLDGRIIAVFNDGKLYTKNDLNKDRLWMGPLNNSLYSNQDNGVGMRMVMEFPFNVNQEREIRLIGVGQDGNMYYKESEDLESPWIQTPDNDLIYLFCDYHQEQEKYYPVLYGINGSGQFVYKNIKGEYPPQDIELKDFVMIPFTSMNPSVSDNMNVFKVYWDRNGFMIGIGSDLKVYQKRGIDWKVRPWEINDDVRGDNPGSKARVIDLLMDNDGRMYGLVIDRKNEMIEIRKQDQPYYLADFDDYNKIGEIPKSYNDQEKIKFSTGLDWNVYLSFADQEEDIYRNNNLQAIHQRNILMNKMKLRKLCSSRNPIAKLEVKNFELEDQIKEKNNKIDQLNKELESLLKPSLEI